MIDLFAFDVRLGHLLLHDRMLLRRTLGDGIKSRKALGNGWVASRKFGGEGNGEVRAWSNEKCREKRI